MTLQEINYTFTEYELKEIAKLLRKNDLIIPKSLEKFAKFTQNYVYSSMTIDEAESLFMD